MAMPARVRWERLLEPAQLDEDAIVEGGFTRGNSAFILTTKHENMSWLQVDFDTGKQSLTPFTKQHGEVPSPRTDVTVTLMEDRIYLFGGREIKKNGGRGILLNDVYVGIIENDAEGGSLLEWERLQPHSSSSSSTEEGSLPGGLAVTPAGDVSSPSRGGKPAEGPATISLATNIRAGPASGSKEKAAAVGEGGGGGGGGGGGALSPRSVLGGEEAAGNSWPRPRSGHAATAVRLRNGEWRLMVLGGCDQRGLLSASDGLWLFDPTSHLWTQIAGGPSPLPRKFHTLSTIGDGAALVVFGGSAAGAGGGGGATITTTTSDLFICDVENSWQWSRVSPSSNTSWPSPRALHTAVVVSSCSALVARFAAASPSSSSDCSSAQPLWKGSNGNADGLVLFGGIGKAGLAEGRSLWILQQTGRWTKITATTAGCSQFPSQRFGHLALVYPETSTRLAIVGGGDGTGGRLTDLYTLDFIAAAEEESEPKRSEDPYYIVKDSNNGDHYEGQNNDGLREGQGTCVYADGSRYEGTWAQDLNHGVGVLSLASGDCYRGDFENNTFHGVGVYTYSDLHPSGEVEYDGEWSQGERSGRGLLKYQSGAIYDGDFARDKPHGKGILRVAPDQVIEGSWGEGKLKQGIERRQVIDRHDGKLKEQIYEGEFQGLLRHGMGLMKYVDGSEYEGQWRNNKRNGHGRFYDGLTQERYEGKFVGNVRQGRGRSSYGSGHKVQGASASGC